MNAVASIIYFWACIGIIGFQIALICGAPWGRLTQGGQNNGPLPVSGRIVAFISIFILVGLALAVRSAAGFWPNWPSWTVWIALVIQSISTLLNWITRSMPERKLWGPIMTVLLALVLVVVFLPGQP